MVILINFLQLNPKYLWMGKTACKITIQLPEHPTAPMYLGVWGSMDVGMYVHVCGVGGGKSEIMYVNLSGWYTANR